MVANEKRGEMLTGSIVALITPFTQEGAIDYLALDTLIEWHIAQGSQGIVLCGSTGEGTSLSLQEKLHIFKQGVQIANGRIPIIAGTGTSSTSTTVELTQAAKDIGVHACLVIVPYYTKPSVQGCIAHYKEVCSVNIPIFVYHHPGRTGIKLPMEALVEIAKDPYVCGIKESTADIEYVVRLSQEIKKPLFCGDDHLVVPLMALKFKGCISVIANLIPKQWQQLLCMLSDQNFEEAGKLYEKYHSLCASLFLESNPQCVKYALYQMGYCLSLLRLPLMQPSRDVKERIREEMQALGLSSNLDLSGVSS
ncbi:4-hydroxy-tetrahydrodipicolinate synthase [Candidatus Rhabdochlamydia oedothoracis]|uniref:4-hydroxy-tetrahydrodipicolinate synthase n=2 Tax=Candidatus Rhabdochlamydiaceae TaxID=689704 RepID=A0ABX8UYH7_9BACT|nr:4-hydroxy-tetrahydrodipicolinate synthase [Candidatus Rhabdochlamydia sp. W815]QYF47991.1 4-hydroxy-tetrahydrodipicolinate synthase [Candidatus Rhabdochlamydia oedothoracis]